jgi:hypothetical protein
MNPVRLPHWPYTIFQSSPTPAGLYARQKWLDEAGTTGWQADFTACVAHLRQGQSADGLWAGSALETIHRLFGLHLTQREPDPLIDKGLDTLLQMAATNQWSDDQRVVSPGRLRGLPFAPGPQPSVVLPALLFLAAIFGRALDPVVLKLYKKMAADLTAEPLAGQPPAALHNRLRALVVHADYAVRPATASLVDWLAGRQTPQGDWGPEIPFYQALNALAHLDTPTANRLTERAFTRLVQHQNPDGSWGEQDRQWHTFLAVHALRNRGWI